MFHIAFIFVCIVMADMFGAWALWQNSQKSEALLPLAALLSFLLGFGLIAYAIWFTRKAEKAHLW